VWAEVNSKWRYWVNSNTDLVSLKVLDSNWIGTSYDILEAIDHAKLNNIKVLNMSFWAIWNPKTSVICEAITNAKNDWIITVVSAWNNDIDTLNTIPAWCSDSIVVWAIDKNWEKTNFSNYGSWILYVPWVDIYSTNLNNTYKTVSWTSFSAPFVTWLVTKELAFNLDISYDNVFNNIKNNYNLVDLEYSWTQTNNTEDEIITWTWLVNTENVFERFSEFDYLFHTEDFIYFLDKWNSWFVYKIINDKNVFGFW